MNEWGRLDIDSNRDGRVEPDEMGRWDWVWGRGAPGAIVLPDLDIEPDGVEDRELAELRVVVEDLPSDVELVLSIAPAAAAYVTVYREGPSGHEAVVGAQAGPNSTPRQLSDPLSRGGENLWIRAHEFPGPAFRGVVEILLVAISGSSNAAPDRRSRLQDRVLLRVAPWIMTPNTLPPEVVYAVDLSAETFDNSQFLRELRDACQGAGVELLAIPGADVSGEQGADQWIQDEIEFGYAQGPGHTLAVVCDGPRNRPLDVLAERFLRGPDVGVVEVGSHLGTKSSLDSFGNLEVSPPVVVNGSDFPLGRVVLGTKRPGASTSHDRKAALALRQFLYAQEVQSPFEIYTDWLAVGHVDEILSFIPADTETGFAVLLASTRRAETFFKDLAEGGDGDLVLWPGRKRVKDDGSTEPAEETISQLLAKEELWPFNRQCQSALDGVRVDLAENLGLGDDAFIEIPVLFKPVVLGPDPREKALAYFPDMVNHLVLGEFSVVPRPYGPRRGEVDLLEEEFRKAASGRQVVFIDDWLPYHEQWGEVHCGTNVRRKPFPDVIWWEHRPLGSNDLSVR